MSETILLEFIIYITINMKKIQEKRNIHWNHKEFELEDLHFSSSAKCVEFMQSIGEFLVRRYGPGSSWIQKHFN